MPIMKQLHDIRDSYTGITGGWYDDDTTKTPEFHVWLKVGSQMFRVTQTPFDDREEAEAFREMLATALLTVVREQKDEEWNNNCKAFTPLRKGDGTYSSRCSLCGWMERDH